MKNTFKRLMDYFLIFYVILLTCTQLYLNYRINYVTSMQKDMLITFKTYADTANDLNNTTEKITTNITTLNFKISTLENKLDNKINAILLILQKKSDD